MAAAHCVAAARHKSATVEATETWTTAKRSEGMDAVPWHADELVRKRVRRTVGASNPANRVATVKYREKGEGVCGRNLGRRRLIPAYDTLPCALAWARALTRPSSMFHRGPPRRSSSSALATAARRSGVLAEQISSDCQSSLKGSPMA